MVIQNGFLKADSPKARGAAPRISAAFPHSVTMPLLVADAVLIVLHGGLGLLSMASALAIPDILRIDRDWSLGEMLNYAKWLALAALSALLFRRQGQAIFLGVLILSLVALLDDSLQLHERFESAEVFGFVPVLHLPRGMGELTFMALEGLAIAGTLAYGWIKAPRLVRRQVVPLLLLLGAAAFCAAPIDFLHLQAPPRSIVAGLLGILEDGGEMVFLSLAVGYAAGLALQARAGAS